MMKIKIYSKKKLTIFLNEGIFGIAALNPNPNDPNDSSPKFPSLLSNKDDKLPTFSDLD